MRQLTLALLKPDFVANRKNLTLLDDVLRQHDFEILFRRELLWPSTEAERFYAAHKNKFFYSRLVSYMTRYGM